MNNVEVIKAIYTAFNAGNLQEMLDYMADDVVLSGTDNESIDYINGKFVGKQQVLNFFGHLVKGADVKELNPCTFIDKGEKIVVVNQILANERSTGRPLTNECIQVATIKNGKLKQLQTSDW
jgi:ketosteroid isomerase-like protein